MDDLKRNGSGICDPTAYKAIRKIQNGGVTNMNIRKGEIWEVEHVKDNKMALVIAHHGSYCSVILLNDEPRESRDIRLNARGMKYAESGMVSYKFCDAFVDFVRKTTDEEFEAVREKVAKSLDLSVAVNDEDYFEKLLTDKNEEIKALKAMCEEQTCFIRELQAVNENLKNRGVEKTIDSHEVAVLKAQLEIYKQQNEKMFERLIGA